LEGEVIVINYKCGVITDTIIDDLVKKNIRVKEVKLGVKSPGDTRILARSSHLLNNSSIILCHPISFELIYKLVLIMMSRPKKVAFIIPPSPRHKIDSLSLKTILYIVRFILALYTIMGIRVLLVFTTPYEKLFFNDIIRGNRYVFLPTYSAERPGFKDLVFVDRYMISIFMVDRKDRKVIRDALYVLEELGFKPLFILHLSRDDPLACFDDYRVLCVLTDDYDDIIRNSAIVVVKEPTPESNNVVLKSIVYNKPVLATIEHGMALYYQDTGLVRLQKKWDGELLANRIIEVLNNLDEIKKRSLNIMVPELKRDYGSHILYKFLRQDI
jgi:hypothetical protein